jgi:hypothetical protein
VGKGRVAMVVSCRRRAFDGDGGSVTLDCVDCCGDKIPANAQQGEGEEESNNDAIEKQTIPTPTIMLATWLPYANLVPHAVPCMWNVLYGCMSINGFICVACV